MKGYMNPYHELISPAQAYNLAQLHAKAMLALEEANWPLGMVRDIWVRTRNIPRKERRERGIKEKTEKVYITEHAITVFAMRLITRSGALYQSKLVGSPSGTASPGPSQLVSFATVTIDDAIYWQDAFEEVIATCEAEKLQQTVNAFVGA